MVCIFYRVIVGELSHRIYGSKTNIPNQLLEMFRLDDERIHTHLRTWTTSGYFGHGFSYSAMIDTKLYTIQHQNIRPKQFILHKLVSISTITESVGVGWDTIASSYFNSGNENMDDSTEYFMTTSNSFEEAYILYSTMKQIKVKMDEKKTFIIKCYTIIMTRKIKEFESVTVNYSKVTNMIKLMSFEIIHNLKPDHFTALPSKWLKNVSIILRKAEVNSIAHMKLYRPLRANECGKLLSMKSN